MGKFSKDEIAIVQAIFNELDSDGSGSLDAADVKAALDGHADAGEIKDVIKELLEADTDGDGKVSLAEFTAKLESME